MHPRRWAVLLACAAACGRAAAPPTAPVPEAPAPPTQTAAIAYPEAPRGAVVDDSHGTPVADPYRWLEEDSPETRGWVSAENALAKATLAAIPGRPALRARLADVYRVPRDGLPVRRGDGWYWTHQEAGQPRPVLMRAASLDAPPAQVLDFSERASESDMVGGWTIGHDGRYLAYGYMEGGGDWTRWQLRDLKTGRDLPEALAHTKYYPPALAPGGRVYYSRFPAPRQGQEITARDEHHRLMLHRIGTPVEQDVVVYERPDHPTWQFDPVVTDDGHYLVITIGDGQVGDRGQEQLAALDLTVAGAKSVSVIDRYEAEYVWIGNVGPVLYVLTTLDAPHRKLIAIDLRRPDRKHWKTIVPAGDVPIVGAKIAGGKLIVTRLVDAHGRAAVHALDGRKLHDVEAPALGTMRWTSAPASATEVPYMLASFVTPGTVHRYDLATGTSRVWRAPAARFDPSRFETQQVFYPSRDGTRVPMFVTARKGLTRDGTSPTILSAYGAGGVTIPPHFVPWLIPWLERGGVYAVAGIRGGGEYGEVWHHAARGRKRQTSIDDFVAAAEWLVSARYTSFAKLGATGGSAGGTLVAMTLVQRPTLFGATVPMLGVYDLLRFPLFGQGAGWETDTGSPSDPDDARVLRALSPVHNVRAGTAYAPTLLMTSDHDVRVAPLHSYKLAAALQAAQTGPAPVLLRVRENAGHGAGSVAGAAAEAEDMLAFFAQHLGMQLAD